MDWNQNILKYSKEHTECTVYGITSSYEERETLSMIVPGEYGTILLQQEVHDAGKGVIRRSCAMIKINLNEPYMLSVNNMNLLKMGWDKIAEAYVHMRDVEFDKKYAVRTNHPEFTKLALTELEWKQFMLQNKSLNIYVSPVEEKGLDHTIKVYYNMKLLNDLFGTDNVNEGMIDCMVQCCKLTFYMLNRYKIEDKEVEM